MSFSRATKRLLLKIFFSIAEFERKVNEIKQYSLRSSPCNVELVFKCLECEDTGQIDEKDILKLLNKYCSHVKESDISTLFSYLGVPDSQNCITLKQLSEALTPGFSSTNVESSEDVPPCSKYCNQCYFEAESHVAELFLFELRSIKKLDYLRAKLLTKEDFSIFEGFSYMDVFKEGAISPDAIRHRFEHCHMMYIPIHIDGIFKQLDKDKDGFISLLEFVDAVFPTYLYKTFPNNIKHKRDLLSQKLNISNFDGGKKKLDLQYSMEDTASQPLSKSNTLNANLYDFFLDDSIEKSNSKQKLDFIFNEQHRHLQNLRKDQEMLSQRHDFNLLTLWHQFDSHNRGYTTPQELKCTLKTLGTNIQNKDIFYFADKFSRECDGKVRFVDLCDALLPQDSFLASRVLNRSAKVCGIASSVMFYSETKRLLGNIFKTQIMIEKLIHSLKLNGELRKKIRSIQAKPSDKETALAQFKSIFGKYVTQYTPELTLDFLERLVIAH